MARIILATLNPHGRNGQGPTLTLSDEQNDAPAMGADWLAHMLAERRGALDLSMEPPSAELRVAML